MATSLSIKVSDLVESLDNYLFMMILILGPSIAQKTNQNNRIPILFKLKKLHDSLDHTRV